MVASTGHIHAMKPIAWSTRFSDYSPRVLFGCTTGVCSKTVNIQPDLKPRSDKHPDFITDAQFAALRDGKHWPEIRDANA